MPDANLKFSPPCQSFADTSFFQELSRLKLDVIKLDSNKRELYTNLNASTTPKSSPAVHLFLNEQSFDPISLEGPGVDFRGSIYNYNTIEEFKNLDKSNFIQERSKELWELGMEDLNKCVGFSVISFADLKKYKFFYWVSVPCFQPETLKFDLLEKGKISNPEKSIAWFSLRKADWVFLVDENDNIMEYSIKGLQKCTAIGIRDTSKLDMIPSALAKNFLSLAKTLNPKLDIIRLLFVRPKGDNSFWMNIEVTGSVDNNPKLRTTGWERNMQGKLTPKATDLSSLIDPLKIADQSIDLNLKLMKWRIVPKIDLDAVKNCKVLLLGAGTLGCYVARSLLAWGVRKITFVDNGTVSFSNPVRQPLFEFEDCGKPKAAAAADSLKKVFPLVEAEGICLEVPMIGHPVTNESSQHKDYIKLRQLIKDHDAVFLLMDSRETRWLPTVLGNVEKKIVINAALGFDSYLVMRHGNYCEEFDGERLGCYFCHDVVAPSDSLTDRTLDQMCTVTRPGVALMASSQAVELLVSVLQHPKRNLAPADSMVILGCVPHQIRGFLNDFNVVKLKSPAYEHCSACSPQVITECVTHGWDFVEQALNDHRFIEGLSGLSNVQMEAEILAEDVLVDWEDGDEDGEIV